MKEFLDLLAFLNDYKNNQNPCFSFSEKKINNEIPEEINENSDKDDF